MQTIWAIVPIKELHSAKQRLAGLLSADERRRLGLAMLGDVLDALDGAKSLAGVLLVSSDPDACKLAQSFNARIISEGEASGLNPAVTHAAGILAQEGIDRILVLHGDAPLATSSEIEQLIAALGASPSMAIAPDSVKRGSNALAISPPTAIAFRYGRDSFPAHLQEAQLAGITPRVLSLPGIAFDIDAPEDLFTLVDADGDTRSQKLLRDLNLHTRTQIASAR